MKASQLGHSELSDVQAAFSEIQISLKQEGANPSLQATDYAIPEDWEIRMSYDYLIKETIPADALANDEEENAEDSVNTSKTYLFFDKSIFDVIIDNEDLTSATLTIGPSGGSQIVIENVHELESLDTLIQEITGSANGPVKQILHGLNTSKATSFGCGHDGMGYEAYYGR